MKDNQRLRVLCFNYSEGATAIENCFVTRIKSGNSDNNKKIIIPQNLTIGSSEADLAKAIAGVNHEKNDSSDS
jgi:cytochrome c551/c552